jgi:hypothetical protein
MKQQSSGAFTFRTLFVVAGSFLFAGITHAANIVIGTGANTSYVVLESGNLGVRTYEIQYDSSSGPYDGKFLLDQILANDSSVAMSFNNFGTVSSPNFFLNSITFNSVTETNQASPPFTPYWVHWVSGGAAGFPVASAIPSGSWYLGSGMSAPYRVVSPGSWDAFVFSDGSVEPSVAPVPEPSGLVMVSMVAGLFACRRRRSA